MLKSRQQGTIFAAWVMLKWQLVVICAFLIRGTIAPVGFVSLTSFPARYRTLGLTLKSVLVQRARQKDVLLWIAAKDVAAIPEGILQIEANGLRIMECEDFRSYNKFVHALRDYSDHKIAICDYYAYCSPHWLGDLVELVGSKQIGGHRLLSIRLDGHSKPLFYLDWLREGDESEPTLLNFPVGVGGMLLGSRKFDPQVIDAVTARQLSPTADDMWFYVKGRRNGCEFVRVEKRFALNSLRSSLEVALLQTNNVGAQANDRQLHTILKHFGAQAVFELPAISNCQSRASRL